MEYILICYTKSKYLHCVRRSMIEFNNYNDLLIYLIDNINEIKDYSIYKLTNLSDK